VIGAAKAGAATIGILTALLILVAGPALAREPLPDAQTRDAIIRDSIARYQAQPGHPCACPDKSPCACPYKFQCRSASPYLVLRKYIPPPHCDPRDVTDGMVIEWRRTHRRSP